jgi:hypothetical protein
MSGPESNARRFEADRAGAGGEPPTRREDMNMMTAISTGATETARPSSFVEAFMNAFAASRRAEATEEADADYEFAMMALHGGEERAIGMLPSDTEEAAITLCCAWKELDLVKAGHFREGGPSEMDIEERAALDKVQQALRNCWEMIDRRGEASRVRPYADYVGIAPKRSRDRWTETTD